MDFPRSPFRITVADLREARLLATEGLLVNLLLDVFVAADVRVDQGVRAAALGLALPPRLLRSGAVITQLAAAWLWCGGPAPPYLDVAQRSGRGRASGPGVVLHERRIAPVDLTVVGELSVTTPARTAADLLRTEPPGRALALLAELTTQTGLTAESVAASLERMSRMRGVALARDLLAGWAVPPPGRALDQSIRLPVTR
jgi:hypothetical protein